MAADVSVTRWIGELQAGDASAAERLWEHYFRRLVGVARKGLRSAPRGAADEEDVALSAFDAFCRGAQEGRFPQLDDRTNLWRLLVTLTARKASDQVRDGRAQKRGGGAVRTESAIGAGDGDAVAGIGQIAGREPTPEFAAQLVEECSRLLVLLEGTDPTLRSIALWKLEGHTTDDIAAKLACAPTTVDRKLRRIRELWADERPA